MTRNEGLKTYWIVSKSLANLMSRELPWTQILELGKYDSFYPKGREDEVLTLYSLKFGLTNEWTSNP